MNLFTTTLTAESFIPERGNSPAVQNPLVMIGRNHPLREQVECFIAQRFLDVHGASISTFMPQLIAVFNSAGHIVAALGIRCASSKRLFLEHYLDQPIEQAISASADNPQKLILREDIVEIGNLASNDRLSSRRLFRALADILISEGFEWATFTGCPSLRKLFSLLGIQTVRLGEAKLHRLPQHQQNWGRYYDDNPHVLAGRVNSGKVLLNSPTHNSEICEVEV